MKLIREETWETQSEVLVEGEGKKSFFLSSPYGIQIDLANRNNRIYPGQTMGKEIARYLNEKVKNGTAYGELGHPTNAKINEERISHRFVDIKQEDKNYFAVKAKIHDTPMGKIVKALIEDGEGKMGISTRAVGSVKSDKTGVQIVQEDLQLITAGDIVADPSAQKAFVQGIYEGAEYEFIDGILIEHVISEVDKKYKITLSTEEKTKVLIETFKKIMNFISKNA